MLQREGEARVRALQKEFLCWVESQPYLYTLSPEDFNAIRKKAFRATFDAFRLGKVGLREGDNVEQGVALWLKFVDWGVDSPELTTMARLHLEARCFWTALNAFRAGAMVAGYEGA